jgi:predicted DNA-binding transcriptional regulator AlpA
VQPNTTEKKNSLPELIKQRDLERHLDISAMTVHRLIKGGKLPSPIKLGGRNYFDAEEVKAALEASRKKTDSE